MRLHCKPVELGIEPGTRAPSDNSTSQSEKAYTCSFKLLTGMGRRSFTIVLEKQEPKGYFVKCLELAGCFSQGRTRKEALKNIREAISLYLEQLDSEVGSKQRIVIEV